MLAVQPEHLPSPALEADHEPSFTEVDISVPKQQTKRKIFTPLNIMILLAALTILGVGAYYVFSSDAKDIKNQIQESHDKIITYADSSKKEGSNSGSSSSKSSTNNNKPNPRSQPAGKDVISSNSKLTGAPGGGDDEDDGEGDDNSEKKNSVGSTTEVDSEEDEEESEEEDYENDPVVWIDQNSPSNLATPTVGSTRDGGR